MKLHLGGHLNWYDGHKRGWLDLSLEEPLLLADLLARLGIPAGEVAIVAVNRRVAPLEGTVVMNEDRVELYPPMGGGAGRGEVTSPLPEPQRAACTSSR